MKKIILAVGGALLAVVAILALTLVSANLVSAQTPAGAPGTVPTTNSAPAAPPAGSPVYLNGKVSSVAASALVLTTARGDITANISASTFIVVNKNGTRSVGSVTDLVVGEKANVVGVATADATVIDARLIAQGGALGGKLAPKGVGHGNGRGNNNPKGRPNQPLAADLLHHTAAGTITAISGDVITLQGAKVDVVTLNSNASTLILNNGFSSLSTLKVGDKVEVLGQPAAPASGTAAQPGTARTINAWAIRVNNGTTKMATAHVAAISGNTVTTNARKNGSYKTINFDANTKFKTLTINLTPGANTFTIADASQSDVHANSNIVVEGVVAADGSTFNAQAVIILPSRGPFSH